VQPDVVSERDIHRAELESLCAEWRKALLAALETLRAEEGVLPPEELRARKRHLRYEYETAAAELRQFARDEWLSSELVKL